MKQYLQALVKGATLSADEVFALFEELMRAEELGVTDAQIGAYLFSSACRPITADHLVGAALGLRKHMLPVDLTELLPERDLLDTAGTGGSGLNSFNTSTTIAFVVAAAGQPVAKHGNRAQTSQSGSADVLSALGINIELSTEQVARCIAATNFGFMFAPQHHQATKRVQAIRRQLGFRTVFNFIGPLSNPAGATVQLLGVSDSMLVGEMAEALKRLGAKRAMVVRGEDGLDEITLGAPTEVAELRAGTITRYKISPVDFGLDLVPFSQFEGAQPEVAARMIRGIFAGDRGPRRDLILLNAGAALYLCGKADGIRDGISLARSTLDSGAALGVLDAVVKFTNSFR